MFMAQVDAFNKRSKKGKSSKSNASYALAKYADFAALDYIRQEIQFKQSPNLINLLK